MRHCLMLIACLASPPAQAQTDDPHLAQADGLRVLHAWTPATKAGADALIYMEVQNTSAAELTLTGGRADGVALTLAGFGYGASGASWTDLPGLPLPPGADLQLEPEVLALRWPAIPQPLVQGADLQITVSFGTLDLPVTVEVGAADARAHSHAGHSH